jgi:gas vesicle protein
MASEYEVEDEDGTPSVSNGGLGWGNILAGAAIGLVIGGALALLFAPKAGDDLRGDLGEAVEDLRERAERLIDDLQGSTQDIIAKSRTTLDQTRENLVRSVEAGREAYAQKRDELSAQFDS